MPDYVPDLFVYLGGDRDLNPSSRYREQILVDKQNIIENYKPLLKQIFSFDYSNFSLTNKKEHIVTWLAMQVFGSVPYDRSQKGGKDLGGGIVPLSNLREGVCRHQGLVFQVLSQVFGIKTQLVKYHIDNGRHSMNSVRLDGTWYLLDVTNPDFVVDGNGNHIWRSAAFKLNKPPKPGHIFRVKQRYSGVEHTYELHDDMYYFIAEPIT